MGGAAALIDVTVPATAGRRRAGLRIHRRPSLRADEVTTKDGIPVTTPARSPRSRRPIRRTVAPGRCGGRWAPTTPAAPSPAASSRSASSPSAARTASGYRMLRFTHRQIATEPRAVAATVAAALAQHRDAA